MGRNLLATGGGGIEHMDSRVSFKKPRIVDSKTANPRLLAPVRVAARPRKLPGYVLAERGPRAQRKRN